MLHSLQMSLFFSTALAHHCFRPTYQRLAQKPEKWRPGFARCNLCRIVQTLQRSLWLSLLHLMSPQSLQCHAFHGYDTKKRASSYLQGTLRLPSQIHTLYSNQASQCHQFLAYSMFLMYHASCGGTMHVLSCERK